jgi:hypothetical protein
MHHNTRRADMVKLGKKLKILMRALSMMIVGAWLVVQYLLGSFNPAGLSTVGAALAAGETEVWISIAGNLASVASLVATLIRSLRPVRKLSRSVKK